ncbi:hypothetical protein AZE42_11214 [Rhizopogon vesiculosus]|uniref:Protein kinase domain-containing protein n=1 Tax=Rhizopogon vesiculosus TaxID=180088 RepID=A0A1J8Q5B1_9AGAM|nr:hypothetical protein AZE42_11214 [Rhizopogon vesiculosus]
MDVDDLRVEYIEDARDLPDDLTPFITRTTMDPIHAGGFGDVWKCSYDADGTPTPVAVKAFKFSGGCDLESMTRKIRREIGILKILRHNNIVPLLGRAKGFGQWPKMDCLVSPWMPNGTLRAYLESRHNDLTVLDRSRLLEDVSAGLHYLHSVPIMHGDITAANILIDKGGNARLIDFGLSSFIRPLLGQSNLVITSIRPGAIRYAAPELVTSDDVRDLPLEKVDIYSFGCVMLQILSGRLPWSEIRSEPPIIISISQGRGPRRPDGHPSILDSDWNFIQKCLRHGPKLRPSADEVLHFVMHRLSYSDDALDLPDELTPFITRTTVDPISAGRSGDVWKCSYDADDILTFVAVKAFRFPEVCDLQRITRNIRREIGILKILRHNNIVPFLGTAKGFGRRPEIDCLVSPWMPNGTLHAYLESRHNNITVIERSRLLKDVIAGLRYLHSVPIMHGDITATNILIDEGGNARLNGFGLSSLIRPLFDQSHLVITSIHSGSSRPWEQAVETRELHPTTDEIFKICPRFRILVIGKTGVGKSSLIYHAFGVHSAPASDEKRGGANIDTEYISERNDKFVLHDSKGFEPGEEDNMKTVREFVQRRRRKEALGDRLHAVWFCFEIPRAGGRLLETGTEDFLQLKRDGELGEIPVVAVLMKYDKFMDRVDRTLNDNDLGGPSEDAVKDLVKKRADAELHDICAQSLKKLGIPYAVVSTKETHKEMIAHLIQITEERIRQHVASEASVITSIAQRIDPKLKMKTSIEVGKRSVRLGRNRRIDLIQ